MALSQADFYAYSRATGAPVPEDPQERAQMAPEVAEFRRNQLKAPEQGQQQGQNALASLAGIGALALAGVGAYRLAKGRLPKGPSRSATAPVVTGDIVREAERTGAVRRAAAETTPAPSKVATPGEPTPEERQRVYAEVAQKSPEELPRVYRPKGGTQKDLLITDPNTGEVFRAGKSPSSFAERYISLRPELKGQKTNLPLERTPGTFKEFSQEAQQFTPRQYLESTGSLEADPTDRLVAEMREFQAARKKQLESRMGRAYGQQLEKTAEDLLEQLQTTAPDLTTIQQSSAGAQQNQFINAVESGEDQITGRYKTQLQRNEDLDLTQVEALENTQGDIRVAASQLPDGLPKDQVEAIPQQTSAQRFLQNERDEIASQLGEQGLPVSPSRIEAELTNRLSGSEAWTYGPKYTQRKQALQLGATYDPRFFENLKTPSVQIAGETIPVESLKEPVIMEDTASRLQERVENKKNWLGQVRLEEQKNKVRLSKVNKEIENLNAYQEEVFNFLKSGKASPEQIKIGQQRLTDLSVDLNRLDTVQNELSNLVYTGNKRIAGAESYVKGAIGEMQLPQKLKTGVEEGMRVFYETDSAGNAIPETLELRGERPMRDLPAKGGGGRNVGEYTAGERLDEEIRAIQGGGRIRDYDPETGAAVQRWEGDKTQTGRELDIYGVRLSSERRDDPEMRPSKPGPSRTPLTRIPTEQSRESFNVARQLRQLQTSGRPGEAQEFLDKIMKQRGISGLSGTFSPL